MICRTRENRFPGAVGVLRKSSSPKEECSVALHSAYTELLGKFSSPGYFLPAQWSLPLRDVLEANRLPTRGPRCLEKRTNIKRKQT